MDEEPPVFLAYQAYKGPASIPHVPGEFFGAFFLAINVRCGDTVRGGWGGEGGKWGVECDLKPSAKS
jgi:hypothetical protein